MNGNQRTAVALLLGLCLALPPWTARGQGTVQVEALLPGMAVLLIDGARHTLRAGESVGGVTLVSASAQEAVFEVGGKRQRAAVSDRIASAFREAERRTVSIPRDDRMQYRTTATINGRRVEVLVDTGASIVALNRDHARALGIDGDDGQRARVETAGNAVEGRVVDLRSVDVGGIRVTSVRATVIDGDFPRTILLGMSYLRHVEISEVNGVLSLTSRY